MAEIRPALWNSKICRLPSMSSEIGFAVRTGVMNVHTLVDATWNQTAPKPAAKQCDQKTGNVSNQTRRGCGLGIDFGMAAGTDHVCGCWSDRDHRGNDGRSILLWNVRYKRAGGWNATNCLCVAGWSRWGWHRKTVRRRWPLLFAHYKTYSFSTLASNQSGCQWRNMLPGWTLRYKCWNLSKSFFSSKLWKRGFPRLSVQKSWKSYAFSKHHKHQNTSAVEVGMNFSFSQFELGVLLISPVRVCEWLHLIIFLACLSHDHNSFRAVSDIVLSLW